MENKQPPRTLTSVRRLPPEGVAFSDPTGQAPSRSRGARLRGKVKIKRIGIDARFFGPKDKGFGRYTENLIRELEKLDRVNQYFVFLRRDSWDEYQPASPNFKKVLADYFWYGIKEQIFLPLKLKKYKLDLVHFTHFNVPIFYRGRFIVTIHDLTLRHFPTYKRSFKNFLQF